MPEGRLEHFRRMYDAGYPRIMAYALRRARSRDDALDVVSDTFMVAWRRFDDAPDEEAWAAWLYGIARRVLANHYRSIDRRTRLVDKITRTFDRTPIEPDTDASDEVREALARLRPDDREILTLVAWDELTNAEIAVALDLDAKNVAVRLHRARRRLAKELRILGYPPNHENQVKSRGAIRTPEKVNGTKPGREQGTAT